MPFREVKKGEKPKIVDKSKPSAHDLEPPTKQRLHLSSPAILSLGFLALIVMGTVLLSLPIATIQPISILAAA